MPEVIAQSGARLVEVGTTNRTRLADYERALDGATTTVGAILRVHPSNFRMVGFVEDVPIAALCELGVPVIDDVGSGVLADAAGPGAGGRARGRAARWRRRGAGLLLGDKLLGGPQAGLIVGRREAVAAARRHPLARALRVDKLSLAALEATLRLYLDPERARREIPVLAMLAAAEGRSPTRRAAGGCDRRARAVIRAAGKTGGGSLPLLELEGPAVALATRPEPLAAALRHGDPPVIARIHEGASLLDPRTLTDAEVEPLAGAVRSALSGE